MQGVGIAWLELVSVSVVEVSIVGLRREVVEGLQG